MQPSFFATHRPGGSVPGEKIREEKLSKLSRKGTGTMCALCGYLRNISD